MRHLNAYVLATTLLSAWCACLYAAPKTSEQNLTVQFADTSVTLPALLVDRQDAFVDLAKARLWFGLSIVRDPEAPLIVLSTTVNSVPIFTLDKESYLVRGEREYVLADSLASVLGCRYEPIRKSVGRIVCDGELEAMRQRGDVIGAAPGFRLGDVDGKLYSSQDLCREGPLVVAFIRSAEWEPFSRDLLTRLDANREGFAKHGARVVVIHGYPPDEARQWRDTLKVSIPLLSDHYTATMRAFGVHQSGNLPHASVFVVDSSGVIRFRHVYGAEFEPPDMVPILEALRALKQ